MPSATAEPQRLDWHIPTRLLHPDTAPQFTPHAGSHAAAVALSKQRSAAPTADEKHHADGACAVATWCPAPDELPRAAAAQRRSPTAAPSSHEAAPASSAATGPGDGVVSGGAKWAFLINETHRPTSNVRRTLTALLCHSGADVRVLVEEDRHPEWRAA